MINSVLIRLNELLSHIFGVKLRSATINKNRNYGFDDDPKITRFFIYLISRFDPHIT